MQVFGSQIFTKSQVLVFEFRGVNMQITVIDLAVVDMDSLKKGTVVGGGSGGSQMNRGVLMQQTSISFAKAPDSTIRLKGARSAGTAIIQPDFKFEDMGIGGLDTEFSAIFRRAFASRIFPPSLINKLGIQHVRGPLFWLNHSLNN
jgi:vesicle-fusing ATPase